MNTLLYNKILKRLYFLGGLAVLREYIIVCFDLKLYNPDHF